MTTLETVPVKPGEVLDGKYRVDRVLGAGGMGVVVAATHVQLQTQVALKFLLPEVLDNPQVVERFVREGRAAVQIQTEHVARVTDVGTLANGSPYMVMEYLEGQDLGDLLAQSGPLPASQAVGYLLQACEAIAEAHALGIVHRDLKPANLFLAKRNRRESIIKVLDFGISKTADAESLGLTKTSALMGSPYYMSPEQMKSARAADARSDIWALGVILYELLAGVPPFQGDTLTEIVVQVTQGSVPNIRDSRPELPQEIDQIIRRCLKRDPKDRYADVAEFARALAPLGPPRSEVALENISRILGAVTLSGHPAAAHAIGSLVEKQTVAQATMSAWARSRNETGLRRRAPVLLAGALVVAGAIAVIAWRMSARSNPSVASSLPGATATAPVPAPAASIPSAIGPTPAKVVEPSAVVASPDASSEASAAVSATPARRVPPRAAVSAAKTAKAAAPVAPAPANRGLNMGMKE